MDKLALEYYETHDPEIPEQIYRLARLLIDLFSLTPHSLQCYCLFTT
jgi:hypothetical protein